MSINIRPLAQNAHHILDCILAASCTSLLPGGFFCSSTSTWYTFFGYSKHCLSFTVEAPSNLLASHISHLKEGQPWFLHCFTSSDRITCFVESEKMIKYMC